MMINYFRGSEDPNSGDPLVALRAFQMAQSKQFRKPVCFPPAHYHHIHQQLLGSQLSSLHWFHFKMKPFCYFPLSLAQVQSSTESLGSALKMIKKRRSLFEHGDYHHFHDQYGHHSVIVIIISFISTSVNIFIIQTFMFQPLSLAMGLGDTLSLPVLGNVSI